LIEEIVEVTMILVPSSLTETLDNINESLLYGEPISGEEGLQAARWIATCQGGKGSYRGLFAPTPQDFEEGIRLFTGERLVCASARHIMGQEAARALWLLGGQENTLREVYEQATQWMQDEATFRQSGRYCCGRCTLAFWRHYGVGDFPDKERLINRGLHEMQSRRSADGKWQTYPFYYSIYTLASLGFTAAREELSYARPAIERYLHRPGSGIYAKRRIRIFSQALALID
jgi:hypothetical protein